MIALSVGLCVCLSVSTKMNALSKTNVKDKTFWIPLNLYSMTNTDMLIRYSCMHIILVSHILAV